MSIKNTKMNIPAPNPNAIKARFAKKFVEAMRRVNKSRGSRRDRYKRYRVAACASMASAVGPQRAWSRAVLRKMMKRRGEVITTKRKRTNPRQLTLGLGQEEDLRGIVPGGKGMGYCSLLTETAHYIKCLQAQVQVMTDILHRSSS